MDYEDFIQLVQKEAGGIDSDRAQLATRATMRVLAQRLSDDQATDLAAQLPTELFFSLLSTAGNAEHFDFDEYLDKVAEHEGVDPETAERHARAVFFALGRAVSTAEIDDVVSELPGTYEPLVAAARG